jgi:uncharacterized membrane protein
VATRATPSLPEPRVVARGLRRARVALVLHALAPVIAIGVALSIPMNTALGLIFPLVALATGLLCMWSLLDVERGRLAGIPRVLYALGVIAIVWSCAMTVAVAFQEWQHAEWAARYSSIAYPEVRSVPWSVLAPVIGLLGFVLVGIALTVHISRAPACAHLRAGAGLTISMLAACALFAGVMEVLAARHEDGFALTVGGVIATILGLLVLARIVDGIASVVEDEPSLPVARLR